MRKEIAFEVLGLGKYDGVMKSKRGKS